jgi:hypothetical protein
MKKGTRKIIFWNKTSCKGVNIEQDIITNSFQYKYRKRRRKIRLIEGNAKCRHPEKLTSKGTLRQVLICLRSGTPYLLPLTHCIHVLFTHRRGEGGELSQREGERSNRTGRVQITKLGWKYQHDWMYARNWPISSLIFLREALYTTLYI